MRSPLSPSPWSASMLFSSSPSNTEWSHSLWEGFCATLVGVRHHRRRHRHRDSIERNPEEMESTRNFSFLANKTSSKAGLCTKNIQYDHRTCFKNNIVNRTPTTQPRSHSHNNRPSLLLQWNIVESLRNIPLSSSSI